MQSSREDIFYTGKKSHIFSINEMHTTKMDAYRKMNGKTLFHQMVQLIIGNHLLIFHFLHNHFVI